MNIAAVEYTLSQQSLDIYISGCQGYCRNCCNPDLWDSSFGDPLSDKIYTNIENKANEFSSMINKIMIFGGEPLDQPEDALVEFLDSLSKFGLPIWLFTHFSIEKVPEKIKGLCAYIKTGEYIPDLVCTDNIQFGIKLATSNQMIYKIEDSDG